MADGIDIDLGAICDNTTIQPNGGGVLSVPLAELVDNDTIFFYNGKLVAGRPEIIDIFIDEPSAGLIKTPTITPEQLFESSSESGNQRSLTSCSALASLMGLISADFTLQGYVSNILTTSQYLWPMDNLFICYDNEAYYILDTSSGSKFLPPIEITFKPIF